MASRTGPGQPGHNPIIAVIAMVVFSAYVDRTWLAILLDMTVLYGLVTDWRSNRKWPVPPLHGLSRAKAFASHHVYSRAHHLLTRRRLIGVYKS